MMKKLNFYAMDQTISTKLHLYYLRYGLFESETLKIITKIQGKH